MRKLTDDEINDLDPREYARIVIDWLWRTGIIGDGEERRKQVEGELISGDLSDEGYAYLLDKVSEKKPPKPGRPHNGGRDLFLVSLLQELRDRYGITPTRSETKIPKPCGCSILADVLRERGIKIGESGIAGVWTNTPEYKHERFDKYHGWKRRSSIPNK